MKNAILTTISDSHHPDFSSKPEIRVFLKSAQKIEADLVILSDKLNSPIPHIQCPILSKIIVVDRWYYYYKFLCHNSYENVLLTDSRDVLLQGNPFDHATNKIMLAGEGLTHNQSTWNTEDQRSLQRATGKNADFGEWPVVNGGIVLGPADAVRSFCLLMYTLCANHAFQFDRIPYTDQAVIGSLWSTFLKDDPNFMLSNPNNDAFCVTGETLNNASQSSKASFQNGRIVNRQGEPYALFHQWDRTEHATEILNMITHW